MDGTTRIGIACLSLVVLWIVVYWITPAPQTTQDPPRVTYQSSSEVPSVPQPDKPEIIDIDVRPPDQTQQNEQSQPTPARRDDGLSAPTEEADSQPRPGRIIPQTFVDYTVREGDNAWTIAERFYGSRDQWAAVLLSNPTVDTRRLFRVGRVIKLAEDPRNIQGVREGEAPPDAPRMDYIEYRVERGDNLSAISQAIYGRAALWRLIQSANADQVNPEGTNLQPGMILKIPPPPAN